MCTLFLRDFLLFGLKYTTTKSNNCYYSLRRTTSSNYLSAIYCGPVSYQQNQPHSTSSIVLIRKLSSVPKGVLRPTFLANERNGSTFKRSSGARSFEEWEEGVSEEGKHSYSPRKQYRNEALTDAGRQGSNRRQIAIEDDGAIKMTREKKEYIPHPNCASRTQEVVNKWMSEKGVTVEGGDGIFKPILTFEETCLDSPVIDMLKKSFSEPTIIQSVSWPIAMSGLDLTSVAQTGSGKTLGFALPGIVHALWQNKLSPDRIPSVVVVVPTRELAQQVESVIIPFCKLSGIRCLSVYGGSARSLQARNLERGVGIVVATPGRLNDFLSDGVTSLKRATYVVLDEADRMLDMGFEPQIREILTQTPHGRQTLMFSATWPAEVRSLALEFQTNPVFANVGSLQLAANPNITQNFLFLDDHEKQDRLIDLMKQLNDSKVLIFVQTQLKADRLSRALRHKNISSLCIHGKKSQTERDWVLKSFRSGSVSVLLATDVASRGLDVNDIDYVINYDYPTDSESYIHRIGRTARHKRKGTSYTFFTPEDGRDKARDLIKVIEGAGQEVPQELRQIASSGRDSEVFYGKKRSQVRFSNDNKWIARKNFGNNGFARRRNYSMDE